jgi:hypothetical protein
VAGLGWLDETQQGLSRRLWRLLCGFGMERSINVDLSGSLASGSRLFRFSAADSPNGDEKN